MTPALRQQLTALIEAAEAASSSYRPGVAAYLYEQGLGRLWAAMYDADAVDEGLLLAAWRLMLESVATRRFGVSSDAWREGDYPDRYFPTLWLDLAPALPRVAEGERLAWLSALFNLGENLPAAVRPQANQLASALTERLDDLVADLEATVQAALEAVGLIKPTVAPPSQWARLLWLEAFDLGSALDGFAPGDLVRVDRGFVVKDTNGVPRLGLRVAGEGLAVDRGLDLTAEALVSTVVLRERTLHGPSAALGEAPGIAPAAVVANDAGEGALLDLASLYLRRFRAVR